MVEGDMRHFGAVPQGVQRLWSVYRLMRIFHLSHPDQVRALPVPLAEWGVAFANVEDVAERERQARMWGGDG